MNSNCVPVFRDDLESEAIIMQCIQSALTLIRAAVESQTSDYSTDVGNVCYLLEGALDTRADILQRMAKGEFTGPKVGGAA